MLAQYTLPRPISSPTRRTVIENGAMGMILFVFVEAMLFSGLVSAFVIAKAGSAGLWPPLGQPRLPAGETAINTVALLLSGAVVLVAGRAYRKHSAKAGHLLLTAILLGSFFVCFQGVEWIGLLREGLTLTSSQQGSFFYLIIGMHAAHAVGAIVFLTVAWVRLLDGMLDSSTFVAARILWYFVVCVWPILYVLVYL